MILPDEYINILGILFNLDDFCLQFVCILY